VGAAPLYLAIKFDDALSVRDLLLFAGFSVFIIGTVIGSIYIAKNELCRYERGDAPVLIMTPEGVEIPLLVLFSRYRGNTQLASGKTTIKIAWKDILIWRVWYQRMYSGRFHVLTLMDRKLMIRRGFTAEEEKPMLDFARRFGVSVIGPNEW